MELLSIITDSQSETYIVLLPNWKCFDTVKPIDGNRNFTGGIDPKNKGVDCPRRQNEHRRAIAAEIESRLERRSNADRAYARMYTTSSARGAEEGGARERPVPEWQRVPCAHNRQSYRLLVSLEFSALLFGRNLLFGNFTIWWFLWIFT